MSAKIPHLLNVQQNAKEKHIKDKNIRHNFGFQPLNENVRSTSSPMSSKSEKSKSILSPAEQASESSKVRKIILSSISTSKKVNLPRLLPPELRYGLFKESIIVNAYVLRDWIKPYKDNLDINELSKNPNSTSYLNDLFEQDKDSIIDWKQLSKNKNAVELLKKRIKYEKTLNLDSLEDERKVNWPSLSFNPNAIELLEKRIEEEKAIPTDMQTDESDEELSDDNNIDWLLLSMNPNAIELLKANKDKIQDSIFFNKSLDEAFIKELITEKIRVVFDNKIWSAPKAIRLLLKMDPILDIDWNQLSENTSIKAIILLIDKAKKEKELTNTEYKALTPDKKINWNSIINNPKAIELLQMKVADERDKKVNNLYKSLHQDNKINWMLMSANVKASSKFIKILEEKAAEEQALILSNLKEYKKLKEGTKLSWSNLSAFGSKAIDLIETKIKDEKKMKETNIKNYENLQYDDKIDSKRLSANPKAIKLLEIYPEYINLWGLCANPNAVKLIKKNITRFTETDWKCLSTNPCIFKETLDKYH